MPRTGSGQSDGTFTSNDGLTVLKVTHNGGGGKRHRHIIRVDVSKVAADPFDSTLNARYSMSAQLHVDVPSVGYTVAEQKAVVDALVAYLAASTGARVTQLLGGEN
jgi:hypothetical protein